MRRAIPDMPLLLAVILCAVTLLPRVAWANYVYTYTGEDFSSIEDPTPGVTTSDHLVISFTTAQLLPANTSFSNSFSASPRFQDLILSWSATAGPLSFNSVA